MSVPSIPSRFLKPVIGEEASAHDGGDSDICKMSRLVNDPGRVGPGSYQSMDD